MKTIPRGYRWYRRAVELNDLGLWGALRRSSAVLRARVAAGTDAPAFPDTVSIEVTDHCNLACPSCPQPLLSNPKGYLDSATIRRIIDECAEHPVLMSLVFTGYGEPLLHPELCELGAYARRRGIPIVRTYTNCKSLTPARAEAILTREAFDELTLSLNGTSPETHRLIKGDDDYTRAQENVRRFLARKRELRMRKPFINLTFLALRGVSYDLAALAADWDPLLGPGDCVRFKDSHDFAGQVDGAPFGTLPPTTKRVPCGQLWTFLFIARDGHVSPCCVDPFKQLTIGNVHDSTLESCWASAALADMRGCHLAKAYGRLPLCERCDTWRYFTPLHR
jgi:MoaA/NifB/PqqE/SkfB family radical SAM enzyme